MAFCFLHSNSYFFHALLLSFKIQIDGTVDWFLRKQQKDISIPISYFEQTDTELESPSSASIYNNTEMNVCPRFPCMIVLTIRGVYHIRDT